MSVETRKSDHIRLALESGDTVKGSTWLEHVHLVPRTVGDVDVNSVETSVKFLGRWFSAPILIEGMTGGTEEAAKINAVLAAAAEAAKIPMGVGSQRAAIVKPELRHTFRVAREKGPKAFLIANIGAAQLAHEGEAFAWEAVKMIEADAIAIHVNLLQEIIQPEGDRSFRGFLHNLRKICRSLGVPVIVKEVGCGLSYGDAVALKEAGVAAVDVAGRGGTNWVEIEKMRAIEAGRLDRARIAEDFLDWGIPTAASVLEASRVRGLEVVGSGGVRSGVDVAKLLVLGAVMGGLARPFLKAALEGVEMTSALIAMLKEEIQIVAALCGASNMEDLRRTAYVITGPLKEWYDQRFPRRARRVYNARRGINK
jgi:isopentenyl-diphosphate delta-isomerase, type 2